MCCFGWCGGGDVFACCVCCSFRRCDVCAVFVFVSFVRVCTRVWCLCVWCFVMCCADTREGFDTDSDSEWVGDVVFRID